MMKALFQSLDGLPTWPRLTLSGLLLGAVVGAIFGVLVPCTLIISSAFDDWQSPGYLAGALVLYAGMGCMVGVIVGGLLGGLTGVIAGSWLAGMLRLGVEHTVAAWATVLLVLAIQVALGLMLAEPGWWWLCLVTPLIATAPMTFALRSTARSWAERHFFEHVRAERA